jgi:hypothetical protein
MSNMGQREILFYNLMCLIKKLIYKPQGVGERREEGRKGGKGERKGTNKGRERGKKSLFYPRVSTGEMEALKPFFISFLWRRSICTDSLNSNS